MYKCNQIKNVHMKKSIFSMLALTVLFTSCEKDNFKPDIPNNVYVVGINGQQIGSTNLMPYFGIMVNRHC